MTGKPDPKPVSVGGIGRKKPRDPKRASAERWQEIRAAKLGPCYVCLWLGLVQEAPSSIHHVVSKSLGGSDTEANSVPVCGDGTTFHHGDIEAHDPVACQALAAAIQAWDDPVYAYAIDKLGEDRWLARYHVRFEEAA